MQPSSVRMPRRGMRPALALIIIGLTCGCPAWAAAPQFEVAFDREVSDKPYTGRVYVIASRSFRGQPLEHIDWFDPQPFFAQDVFSWKPGQTLRLDPQKCLGYPEDLEQLPGGRYRLQAVMDLNGWSHDVIKAPGNGVSKPVTYRYDPDDPKPVELRITRTLPQPELRDTADVKYVRLRSRLLSDFHGRDVYMQAAVGLPAGYDEDRHRHYAAVYVVSGFGGTIQDGFYIWMMRGLFDSADFDAVVVYIDADFPTGHHVFADSANNGPCGTALVKELIPHLEERFRLIPEADARYVTGVSSGGWSSLWLQVSQPETFGGVWSMSPDPVDFSAFQVVNIYDPNANFVYDEQGELRRFSRPGMFGKPIVLRDFVRMEETLGRGGQFQSFDAVFSPRGPDGKPMPLFDRETGRIDPHVAQAWKKYDIRLVLESNWESLGPKLQGKLHLYCGDRDEFFLERAFYKLRDSLEKLGSDAYIEVVPEAGHMLPPMAWIRTARQMKQCFEAHYGSQTSETESSAAPPQPAPAEPVLLSARGFAAVGP